MIGKSGKSIEQPLKELHWLLMKWNECKYINSKKRAKYVKKVENWFKLHGNILLMLYPKETMNLLNKFDVINDNIIKGNNYVEVIKGDLNDN